MKRQPSVTPDEYRKLLTPRKAKRIIPAHQQRPRTKLRGPVEVYAEMDILTANRLDAMNPYARGKHRKAQRVSIAWQWLLRFGAFLPALPVTVTLIRVARRRMDRHDAINHAMKHIADQVTECLGLTNDDTGEIEWRYDQQSLDGRDAGVIIRVEAKEVGE